MTRQDRFIDSLCGELEKLAAETRKTKDMVRISWDTGLHVLLPAAKLIRDQRARIEELEKGGAK